MDDIYVIGSHGQTILWLLSMPETVEDAYTHLGPKEQKRQA